MKSGKEEGVTKTRTGKIWAQDDIIFFEFAKDCNATLSDAKIDIVKCMEFLKIKKRPILVDLTKLKFVSNEARKYYSNRDILKKFPAIAFYTTSQIYTIVTKLYLNFNSPQVPIKIFTSKEKALEWLKEYRTRREI